ncbi:MAG: hypothetical protein ACE5G0_17130 [Rhodothermales bacterium]
MTTQNTFGHSRCLPHFKQARTWYRYVKCLRDRSFDARCKKEEALMHSLHLRSRTFVLPTRLELTLDAEQGLHRLKRFADGGGAGFVELAARIIQVDDEDPTADEVHLFLEEPDRTSSRNRRHLVGLIPQEDACWVVPLLRLESDAYGTGPLLGFFVERFAMGRKAQGGICADTSEVHVVIARAHEAARQWLDWKEECAARMGESYRLRFYDEQACATP